MEQPPPGLPNPEESESLHTLSPPGRPSVVWPWVTSLLRDYGAVVSILAIGIAGLVNIGTVKEQIKAIPELRVSDRETHTRFLPEIRDLIAKNNTEITKSRMTTAIPGDLSHIENKRF